jgi:hypothetical protein
LEIGLIDVDSHNFPNLALMKLSAYHKRGGDQVEWWNGLKHYDVVYQSKVFDDTLTKDIEYVVMADEIIKGGTGYDLHGVLPDDIEHICPDYELYGEKKAYGFLTRGCPRACPFCIVNAKEGNTHTVAELGEFYNGQKEIVLLDPNILAGRDREKHLIALAETKAYIEFNQGLDARFIDDDITDILNRMKFKDIHFAWDNYDDTSAVEGLKRYARKATNKPHGHFGMVYVLTNFGSTHDQDLERVYKLREMDYDPFVMIYDKAHAPEKTKKLARWCNNKWIFSKCESFEEYAGKDVK